jgi:hypothetical protein
VGIWAFHQQIEIVSDTSARTHPEEL